jgi:hypothetical protein
MCSFWLCTQLHKHTQPPANRHSTAQNGEVTTFPTLRRGAVDADPQEEGGAMQEVSTTPRRPPRTGLYVVMAVVVVATALALAVLVDPTATTSGAGADDARPNAGSAIVHDDAGNVGDLYYPLPPGKAASDAGPAVLHDDAGNVNR